jgi:hypothetical protein
LLRALRPWRFFGFAIAKQALQKARAFRRGWGFQLAQRFALQTAEFAQQRHFPRLADPTVQLLGEFFSGWATSRGSGNACSWVTSAVNAVLT